VVRDAGVEAFAAEELADVLVTLPHRQRAAIVLRYYHDLPDREIARVLGCRVGTVASLVHRALERLREVLPRD
jgi:RNA polymerase sigma factor (sigma-70 family)